MERTITIDGREVRLKSSAALPRLYRIEYHRDILADMRMLAKALAKEDGQGASHIPLEALGLFEDIAYLMAKHADPEAVPDTPEAWLDSFETFSIYKVFPVIQELWAANLTTMASSKKK